MEELYKYDPRNRLTEYIKGGVTTQFTYDNAGNLLKDDKAKYTYDAFNRTEKVETFDGHVQINRYDAEGLRHEMEEDGRLVQFIFRGDEVIAEEKDSSVIRYIRGYDLIASDAESARTYYHYASDEMSSITHIVGSTHEMGADQVLNHYEYDAWGNTTVCEEAVENRFRFNGQQYDPITQQYYLRARFYNPVIARFTQEDTYRGDGLNLYVYCANNLVYYEDPSGHYSKCMKEAYLEVRRNGMSKEEAYAYAKKVSKLENINKQLEQQAQIESELMSLVDKAEKYILTKDEYKRLREYSELLGAGQSSTFGDDRNPLIKARKNRDAADTMRGTLLRSQRGLTKNGKDRTVASDGTKYSVSGYSPKRMSMKQLNNYITVNFNKIISDAALAGYTMAN